MRKNNTWNRYFYAQETKENQKKSDSLYLICKEGPRFIESVKNADSLILLFNLHKDIWGTGFRNANIGPNPYGIVRTKDVASMVPCEVYLGGVYGLNTHTIPYWETYKKDEVYKIVLQQYRDLLLSNINYIFSQSMKELAILVELGY